MSKLYSFLILVIINVQCQSEIIFRSGDVLETGDECVTNSDGAKVKGVCMPIQKCNTISGNLYNFGTTSTVCGYDNHTQIICCPNPKTIKRTITVLVDNLDCDVVNSNEKGVIKFLSECPELNKRSDIATYVNKLCTDDICSDLVCCPIMPSNRLKNVCWKVDHPSDTLQMRLLLNRECTVKELNITGRYQLKRKCSFLKRNPNLLSMLAVCSYDVCKDWYCCPIEDNDVFDCTAVRIQQSIATLVGPKCINSKSGLKGTCKRLSDCSHDFRTMDKCGDYCCQDYYCCPDDESQVNESISSRECNSYTKYLSKEEVEVPINLYSNRTVCSAWLPAGGVFAFPGEFPHMAALGYQPAEEILWNCGGSLISSRYVLTAGHCLIDRHIGPVLKVRLGVIDLRNVSDSYDCPEDFDVARVIPHPEYNAKFVYNDIGLIELCAPATFNFHIRPICLPSSADVPENYVSMGWGATGHGENPTVRLIKVYQSLFSYEACQMQYDVGRRYPKGIINETHICAGSKRSIQSTCPGDSGGPLVEYDSKQKSPIYTIQGIVSFGAACGFANSPGVHTKVFPYVNWIEEMVWKN